MVMQDIVTTVQYRLPSIHVFFSNLEYGFIKVEQEDTNHSYYGVDFKEVDYAKIGEAQGAIGFTIIKINHDRPIPA